MLDVVTEGVIAATPKSKNINRDGLKKCNLTNIFLKAESFLEGFCGSGCSIGLTRLKIFLQLISYIMQISLSSGQCRASTQV